MKKLPKVTTCSPPRVHRELGVQLALKPVSIVRGHRLPIFLLDVRPMIAFFDDGLAGDAEKPPLDGDLHHVVHVALDAFAGERHIRKASCPSFMTTRVTRA
jgi:hypothetical protein